MSMNCFSRLGNVPVVMYHSVSNDPQWLWGHMSCSVHTFEEHVRALVNAGFTTIGLSELYDSQARGAVLPRNPIVLTFDDGYLDNWAYVFPILKRYDCKGVVFVNPEFVDPNPTLRPTLDDVQAGRVAAEALEYKGFLSWAELAAMDASGVMDVQSHALTHTWYFQDDRIVDFHHPGDKYPWLAWNVRPERKYLWLTEDQSTFVPFGAPVYTYGKALVTRQYEPDARLTDHLVEQVARRGELTFFREQGWRHTLERWAADYRLRHDLQGRFESEEAYQQRVRYELGVSKEIIEAKLHKRVDFLAWPGGGHNDLTIRTAQEVGYRSLLYSPGSPSQPGQDAVHIPRLPVPTLPGKTRTLFRSGRYLVYWVRSRQGSFLCHLGCKLLSAYEIPVFRLQEALRQFVMGPENGREPDHRIDYT